MATAVLLLKFAFIPVSFAVFGVLFVLTGLQRLWGVPAAARKGEAMFWGSAGGVLGLVFLGLAVRSFAFVKHEADRDGPPPETGQSP